MAVYHIKLLLLLGVVFNIIAICNSQLQCAFPTAPTGSTAYTASSSLDKTSLTKASDTVIQAGSQNQVWPASCMSDCSSPSYMACDYSGTLINPYYWWATECSTKCELGKTDCRFSFSDGTWAIIRDGAYI